MIKDFEGGRLYKGDCLEVMRGLEDKSVDMILCDLPYGTTACKWDAVIPFEPLWEQYERIIKNTGAIVLTASQPFTTALISSNYKLFRYCLIWDKVNKYTGALNANRMPLKRHEEIAVFYKKLPTYNKQLREGTPYVAKQTKGHGEYTQHGNTGGHVTVNTGGRNPCSIIEIPADNKKELGIHPTQKPVALFEYLIKTYSNEGDVVLDNCSGSGTTGIAAINTNRKFILIEQDDTYFEVSGKRIEHHTVNHNSTLLIPGLF
jgi:site-specific DNA-methyltransferase (adenine-specific)